MEHEKRLTMELTRRTGIISQICDSRFNGHALIYKSEIMNRLVKKAITYAATSNLILLTGESGTGKEVFANLIHKKSKRADKPLINVNCAALPAELFEAEMFGAKKGSFSGAISDLPGKMQLAHEGTILLDEISELPLQQQAKLLRVIENNEICPVGGQAFKVDVRFICATNVDLETLCDAGKFRRDLYHRLNVLVLNVLPLRERKEDIPLIADYFLLKHSNETGGVIKQFNDSALQYLSGLSFKGNIRELKNFVTKLYHDDDTGMTITAADIDRVYQLPELKIKSHSESLFSFDSVPMLYKDFKNKAEVNFFSSQLRRFDNNLSRTANAVGMHPGNLYRKLCQLGIKSNKKLIDSIIGEEQGFPFQCIKVGSN